MTMWTAVPALSLVTALASAATAQEYPADAPGWELGGNAIRLETFEGRPVIAGDNGSATRKDLRIEDGTIEFDVRLTRRRSFVYLKFRMQDEREYEEIYLRPHKSGLPDAIQYAPVYQGQSAWQLHHGPGATASPAFAPGSWTHVRVVLRGQQAAVFLGDAEAPALAISRLARAPKPGYVALRVFVPPNTPGTEPAARFANLRVSAGRVDGAPPPASPTPAEPGVVAEWSLSGAFKWTPGAKPEPPPAGTLGAFRKVGAEPSGLVELHRHVPMLAGERDTVAAARLNLRASKAGTCPLDLGFSDRAIVFLNGVPLFDGDASYSFDEPRRDGLIGFDQARLFLPLRAGDNQLLVVVLDGFGGMGLMGRVPPTEGVQVQP
jgi:hypothetical protein